MSKKKKKVMCSSFTGEAERKFTCISTRIHIHPLLHTFFFPQKIFCLDWEWASETSYESIITYFQVPVKVHNIFCLPALEGKSTLESERKPGNSFGDRLVLNSKLLKKKCIGYKITQACMCSESKKPDFLSVLISQPTSCFLSKTSLWQSSV